MAALAGCTPDSKPTTVTAPDPAAPAAAGYTLAAPGYRTWRGVLPGAADSITLHVVQTGLAAGRAEATPTIVSYSSAGSGAGHYLYARRVTADSLILEEGVTEETGNSEAPALLWRLRRNGVRLTGTRAGQPISLHPGRPPGSLPLTVFFAADSVMADAQLAASARGRVSLLALTPAGPPALTAALLGFYRGDTATSANPAPALPPQWQASRSKFEKIYRADVAEIREAHGDSTLSSMMLEYERQQLTHVIWNEAGLLSLGLYMYTYLGGAHGYGKTVVASFDTRTGRRLTYDDVFVPGAEKPLVAALDHAARRQLGLAVTDTLGGERGGGALFVAHIPVTRNVCLTGDGALFVYPPYALASYAQGEFQLFVPFRELRGLLRPGLPGVPADALTRR